MRIWAEPFIPLRVPKVFNLRTGPYERADITSNTYYDWFIHRDYIALAATSILVPFLETFSNSLHNKRLARFRSIKLCKRCRMLQAEPATSKITTPGGKPDSPPDNCFL